MYDKHVHAKVDAEDVLAASVCIW